VATRSGIDSSIVGKLEGDHVFVFWAVKAEFDTADVRLHTWKDELTINSETYEGAGTLLSIGDITDSSELKSDGVTVAISGMDTTVLGYALTENYQNRPITIYMGYLDGGGEKVSGVMTAFKGRMQAITITDDPQGASTVVVESENRLVDLRRPSNLRYTKESQKFIDSTDTAFNRVQQVQKQEIYWGRKRVISAGGGGDVDQGPPDDEQSPWNPSG
tara:strand:- start:725 stop:1375 length:651 start_codon:yes stop_codon:yes gene_type:complete